MIDLVAKKSKEAPDGTISLGVLSQLLGLKEINKKIEDLDKKIDAIDLEDIKKNMKETVKEVIMNFGSAVNISNVESIEKNENIKPGTIYFNVEKNLLRIKNADNRWITFNLE